MTEKFIGLFDVRDGIEADKNFILATFLRGLYYGDSWFSQTDKDSFMNNYKLFLEKLIYSPNVMVKIACLPEDPSVILGYSILSLDAQTVHWVYVKEKWRRKGVGSTLVPKHPLVVTHLTKLGKELLPKINNPKFDPFKL